MHTRTTLQAARIRRSAAERAALHLKTLELPLKSATAQKSHKLADHAKLASDRGADRRSPRRAQGGGAADGELATDARRGEPVPPRASGRERKTRAGEPRALAK